MALVETKVDDHFAVSPQIEPGELPTLAEAGYTMVINNRPDFEEPGQPTSAEIEAAAHAAGLTYRSVPLANGALSPAHVEATRQVLGELDGRALAYCRSGTRSYVLYALATAPSADALATTIEDAAAKGYDIRGAMAAAAWL